MDNTILCTPQPTLSSELRALIDKRNVLTAKSKAKVICDLDKQITEECEAKRLSMHSKAIEEILTSEFSYLRNIEIIMKYFKQPIRDNDLVSEPMLDTVFGDLESLYNINGELLRQLKSSDEDIGTAFLNVAPFFKMYSAYAFDYKCIPSLLQNLNKTNPKLMDFIKRQETRPEVGCSLTSLLITPVQRIPRYRLLLKEVLHWTAPDHVHYPVISEALEKIEAATAHINGLIFEQENMQRTINLQRCLVDSKPTIIIPSRKLIKEGVLMKVSSNGKRAKSRYFVLFSDMILYCKILKHVTENLAIEPSSLKCSCVLPIKKCLIQPVLSDGVLNLSCQGETFILYTENREEASDWVTAIRSAIVKYEEGAATLCKKISSRRPLRHKDLKNLLEQPQLPSRGRKRKYCTFEDKNSTNSKLKDQSPKKMIRVGNNEEKENQVNITSCTTDTDYLSTSQTAVEKCYGYYAGIKCIVKRVLQPQWICDLCNLYKRE